jgi:hypothetical protein
MPFAALRIQTVTFDKSAGQIIRHPSRHYENDG